MSTTAPKQRHVVDRILDMSVCDGLLGCWTFGGKARSGRRQNYGKVFVGGERRTGVVHRVVYEYFVGPIVGTLDHKCRNTLCFNPAHLEDISLSENVARENRRRGMTTAQLQDEEEMAALLDSES